MVAERKDAASLVERILAEELTPRQRAVLIAIGVKGVPMDEVRKSLVLAARALGGRYLKRRKKWRTSATRRSGASASMSCEGSSADA